MPRHASLDLVDLIYDAAAEPDLWDKALVALAEHLDGTHANLLGRVQRPELELAFWHWGRHDPEFSMKKSIEYYDSCPWWTRLDHLPPGKILLSDEILPLSECRRTAWYAELLAVENNEHVLFASLAHEHGIDCRLNISRSAAKGPYTTREMNRLRPLLPHLRRAALLHCKVNAYQTLARNQQDLLDCLEVGVVVIDKHGSARCANRAAERMILEGGAVTLRGARISAHDPRASAELSVLMAATANGGAGGTVALPRRNSALPLLVLVCPLRGAIGDRLDQTGGPRTGVALFLKDPAHDGAAGLETVLAQFYRLTSAETRVAMRLAAGSGLAGAAQALALSDNTVKTHAKRIYEKMGLKSRAELVHRLGAFTAPVVRGANT